MKLLDYLKKKKKLNNDLFFVCTICEALIMNFQDYNDYKLWFIWLFIHWHEQCWCYKSVNLRYTYCYQKDQLNNHFLLVKILSCWSKSLDYELSYPCPIDRQSEKIHFLVGHLLVIKLIWNWDPSTSAYLFWVKVLLATFSCTEETNISLVLNLCLCLSSSCFSQMQDWVDEIGSLNLLVWRLGSPHRTHGVLCLCRNW